MTVTDDIAEVVTHYQVHHPRSRPGTNERRLIRNRLADGYSVGDLKDAIDGCHRRAWNTGVNPTFTKYTTLELIVRNSSQVDMYLETPVKKRASSQTPKEQQLQALESRRAQRVKIARRDGRSPDWIEKNIEAQYLEIRKRIELAPAQ